MGITHAYVVEVELTTGNWTDISLYVKHININRRLATAEAGLSAGAMQITVMNNDSRFSPNKASGAYYPNMRINKAIRVKAGDYWLFTGVIEGFSVNPVVGDKTCTISASDKIKLLQYRNITLPLKTDINAKTLFEDVSDAIGITSGLRTIDTLYETVSFAWFQDRRPIEVLNELMVYGNYQMYVGADGKLVIKNRYWGLAGSSVATYDEFEDIGYEISENNIANNIVISGSPRKQAAAVTVIANMDDIPLINAGDTITFTLPYYDTLTKETGVPANEVITPVATTDYTANSAEDGVGTDKTGQLTVNTTIYGASIECEITNNDSLTVHITKFQVRGKPIQKQFTISATAQDATSITAYGQRDYKINSDYISTFRHAQDYSDYAVSKKKSPIHVLSAGIKNIWPDCATREMGDILTLAEGNTGISGKYIVMGIEHDIVMAEGFDHINSYQLEQWIDTEFFVLDDATLGQLDNRRLAF